MLIWLAIVISHHCRVCC